VKNSGFVMLFRSVRETDIWRDQYMRYYLDLLMEASYERRLYRFGDHQLQLERGQYVTTYRRLATRWTKNLSWVSRFLKRLERSGLVRLEKLPRGPESGTAPGTHAGTLITLLNYDADGQLRDMPAADEDAERHARRNIEVISKNNNRSAIDRNHKTGSACERNAVDPGTHTQSKCDSTAAGIPTPPGSSVGEEYRRCMERFGRRATEDVGKG